MGRGSGRRGWWPGSPRGGLMPNAELRAFLSALGHIEAGGITEVCIFQGGKKPTHVGYFDNVEAAAKAIETHDGRGNIFVTLNPAKRSLLARCNNRLVEGTYKNPAERTKDTEIHRDLWFLFDVDPERPSGISSTDEEKREALEVAKAIRDWLMTIGVPVLAMITADSGNGAYVLVRTPDCEVTDEHTERKKAFLNFVADKFDTQRVKIDRTVYNPARLIGALGSLKVKGENTDERPHRRSSVRTIAGELFDASKEQYRETFDLYDLAKKILPPAEAKKTKPGATNKTANGAYNGLDARKIAHLLENHKPTGNGFDRYDCPNCGNTQKLWVNAENGKFGCYEPDSVCAWRKLRDKLRELAREAGIEIEAQKESRQAPDVASVLSRIVTAQSILETEYPEPKWAVKKILPEGTTIIAGPPKLGKSIFSLNLAVAVAEGGPALSYFDVGRGAVLYLALEDGERRIKERLCKLTNGRLSDNLEVVTRWPRLNEGGLEAIEAWINRHSDARLLIVDTFKRIRAARASHHKAAGTYDVDYDDVVPLTELTTRNCVALALVAHTRKAIAEDVLAMISGSFGLTGAADGALVLARPRNSRTATMSVIGRDVEEQELALEFKPDNFLWSVLGKADDERRSSEREESLGRLVRTGEPLAPGEIAEYLDKLPVSTRTLLYKMREKGEIALFGKKYQLPDYKPPAQPDVESVPSVPKAKKTGNARKTKRANGLDAERSRVPSVPNITQKHTQTEGAQSVGTLGTLGTRGYKFNDTDSLTAFPGENGSGNAGNVGANGVPVKITSEIRRQLYDLGYQGADINRMTPADAHHILATNAPPRF